MEEEEAGNHKTRDFICACGKNYLSYAALFTHIKQKHDGKAPGPIVRPRSERKRGRPRKNPLNDPDAKNSDSDGAKNGISITNEINNNINIFQKRGKLAAQLLGCGQFKAFQAYRPQSVSHQKSKNERQLLRRPGFKKCVSGTQKFQQKVVLQQSSGSCEPPQSLKQCRSAPLQKQQINTEHSSYQYNFIITHLESLFEDYEPTEQQYSCSQIIDIFDWISQELTSPALLAKKNLHDQSPHISIEKGFQLFLLEIQDNLEEFEFKQVSFLLSLFYEFISQELGKPSNSMSLGIGISDFPKYVSPFLYTYLPNKINQLSVTSLYIFKDDNSTKIMLCLCNWLSLREMSDTLKNRSKNKVYKKQEFKSYINQQMSQHVANQQVKNQKCSSQQQIQFQEINDMLEARKIKLRQNIQEEQIYGRDEEHQQNSQHSSSEQQSYGESQGQEGSYECPNKKNLKNTKNASCIAASIK